MSVLVRGNASRQTSTTVPLHILAAALLILDAEPIPQPVLLVKADPFFRPQHPIPLPTNSVPSTTPRSS